MGIWRWRSIHSSGSLNRSFAQLGLHKSGELFAYQNTLTPIGNAGATISGQVIADYGDHLPISGLPLRIRQKDNGDWDTHTDANGYFTLTDLPVGRADVDDVDDDHLSFWVTIDSPTQTFDLGKVKYPMIHPPLYYYWQATPLADLNQLVRDGQPLDFTVCAQAPAWVRPDPATQLEGVFSRLPFSQFDPRRFEKFQRAAVLYDTFDVVSAEFPRWVEPG